MRLFQKLTVSEALTQQDHEFAITTTVTSVLRVWMSDIERDKLIIIKFKKLRMGISHVSLSPFRSIIVAKASL